MNKTADKKFEKFVGGSCTYCKKGFTATDTTDSNETTIWHTKCKPPNQPDDILKAHDRFVDSLEATNKVRGE